jgi:hypothetical protein
VAQITQKQPIGVVAALSTGFDTVTRQLWLLAVPAGLDLFLWLGPRLKAIDVGASVVFDIPAGLDAQTRLFAQDMQAGIQTLFDNTNWFVALRPILFGAPGLMGGVGRPPTGSPVIDWPLVGPLAFLIAVIALSAVGIGLGGLYWTLIARQARDGRIDWGAALGRMVEVWPRLITLALLIAGGAFLIWLSIGLIGLVLGTGFGLIGALAVMLALSLLAWLLFYATFSLHGVVLYNQRALDALRTSVWLGRAHFWPTLGLLGALLAVEAGMGLIWRLAPVDSWLWAVSIGGHAFVVAGLSMATMIYYLDRVPIPRSTLMPQ